MNKQCDDPGKIKSYWDFDSLDSMDRYFLSLTLDEDVLHAMYPDGFTISYEACFDNLSNHTLKALALITHAVVTKEIETIPPEILSDPKRVCDKEYDFPIHLEIYMEVCHVLELRGVSDGIPQFPDYFPYKELGFRSLPIPIVNDDVDETALLPPLDAERELPESCNVASDDEKWADNWLIDKEETKGSVSQDEFTSKDRIAFALSGSILLLLLATLFNSTIMRPLSEFLIIVFGNETSGYVYHVEPVEWENSDGATVEGYTYSYDYSYGGRDYQVSSGSHEPLSEGPSKIELFRWMPSLSRVDGQGASNLFSWFFLSYLPSLPGMSLHLFLALVGVYLIKAAITRHSFSMKFATRSQDHVLRSDEKYRIGQLVDIAEKHQYTLCILFLYLGIFFCLDRYLALLFGLGYASLYYKLSKLLGERRAGIRTLSLLVPLLNISISLKTLSSAAYVLTSNGINVAFLGVKPNDLKSLKEKAQKGMI